MGFIRSNYEIKELGISIPSAYARITSMHISGEGKAYAKFSIQQTRDAISTKDSLETVSFATTIDKTQPIFRQIYVAAKEELFNDWEDDIIE